LLSECDEIKNEIDMESSRDPKNFVIIAPLKLNLHNVETT